MSVLCMNPFPAYAYVSACITSPCKLSNFPSLTAFSVDTVVSQSPPWRLHYTSYRYRVVRPVSNSIFNVRHLAVYVLNPARNFTLLFTLRSHCITPCGVCQELFFGSCFTAVWVLLISRCSLLPFRFSPYALIVSRLAVFVKSFFSVLASRRCECFLSHVVACCRSAFHLTLSLYHALRCLSRAFFRFLLHGGVSASYLTL